VKLFGREKRHALGTQQTFPATYIAMFSLSFVSLDADAYFRALWPPRMYYAEVAQRNMGC